MLLSGVENMERFRIEKRAENLPKIKIHINQGRATRGAVLNPNEWKGDNIRTMFMRDYVGQNKRFEQDGLTIKRIFEEFKLTFDDPILYEYE